MRVKTRQEQGTSSRPARQVAVLGMLLGLCVLLSWLETLLPALPLLPPGAKLGLSNLAVMLCATAFPLTATLGLAAGKSLFVLLTRGATAGLLSLAGGLTSAVLMWLCLRRTRLSLLPNSVAAAVVHNLGQLAVSVALLGSAAAWYYLPFLLCGGVFFGICNGLCCRLLLPALQRATQPT